MEKITKIKGREILDSRGDPTVEVELETESGYKSIASVPSGASVGSSEALELRDNDKSRFGGKGVLNAIKNVETVIGPALTGQDVQNQQSLDKTMIDLDGSPHKSKLGANAILAVSIAACKAAALSKKTPLYSYIAELSGYKATYMPRPMYNFIEGAKHADNELEIQEFLVIPTKDTYKENYRSASELFHKLKKMLVDRGLDTAVGHEGGFAPQLKSDEEALKILSELEGVKLALDTAGVIPNGMTIDQMLKTYPIVSIEDPYGEEDWSNWIDLMNKYNENILIVGDDNLATNIERLKDAVNKKAVNAAIVKPNQIGTITETINFVKEAKNSKIKLVVSHRSGETEDPFIADFAVGVASEFLKFGAPSRGERVSKYNRLLRIEEELFSNAK